MKDIYKDTQIINVLDKNKGGYCYLTVPAFVVDNLENKRKTRLICFIKNHNFQCGLNHLGEGNFFIILGSQRLKEIEIKKGDKVTFSLQIDLNPLGVDVPEVLEVILSDDKQLKNIYENLSLGKKRSLIFAILKIKNIDKQIIEIPNILNTLKSGTLKDLKMQGSQRRWGI